MATAVSATRSADLVRNVSGVRTCTRSSGTLPRWPSRQPASQIRATAGASSSVAGRIRGSGNGAPAAAGLLPMQAAHLLLQLRRRPVDGYAGRDVPAPPAARTGPDRVPPLVGASRPNCTDETAYTIRPRPTHACAAEHIAQCSPEV